MTRAADQLNILYMTQGFAWWIHFGSVAFMCGLIWMVQLVHYPLMNRVAPEKFVSFHAAHSARISWIVGPVMASELVSAVTLMLDAVQGASSLAIAGACLAMTLGVFGATAFLSVPQHSRLARGFDSQAHSRLVSTNWVRTVIWSVHLAFCLWVVMMSKEAT